LKNKTADFVLEPKDKTLFEAAWKTARKNLGDGFTFYLPGMVKYGQERGRYPAVSITAGQCALKCEHCQGRLLAPMIKVAEPQELVEKCLRLKANGMLGVLLSGGSDPQGRLPWEKYLAAITVVRAQTGLFLSAHVGFPDSVTCRELKKAGVRQALLDVMGDDKTARRIYHLPGIATVQAAMQAIQESGLEFVPHVVAGLYYGDIKSEIKALEMIAAAKPTALVIVVLTPLKKTAMAGCASPPPLEVARLIAQARLLMPEIPISLGCERPRNKEGLLLERLALQAGITRMAVWSEEAIAAARVCGLQIEFQKTCCSVGKF
jgi:uncharacterized radical SAM superfamily protein